MAEENNTSHNTDNPEQNPVNTPFDSSALFNERGFYRKGLAGNDVEEIINDFNGELGFRIPIYNFKGPGDLFAKLEVGYSSSVNHNIISASPADRQLASLYAQYNYSMPEWFISFNGIVVQALNFEPYFYTQKINNNNPENGEIKPLITGYHITNEINIPNSVSRDKIYILESSGAVTTLINLNSNGDCGIFGGEACLTGYYYSQNKKNYTRAFVEYREPPNNNYEYRLRKMTYMRGDGLTYIFEEVFLEYFDLKGELLNNTALFKKPRCFLLKYVKDRFGNTIELEYTSSAGSEQIYGRPIITGINYEWDNCAPIYLGYQSGIDQIILGNYVKGNYRIYCDESYNFNPGVAGSKRVNLKQLDNPFQRAEAIFTYMNVPEERQAVNLAYGNRFDNPASINIKYYVQSSFNHGGLKRIKTFTNNQGLLREYFYLPYNQSGQTLLNMRPPEGATIQSENIQNYYGQGRDLFFSFMLEKVETKLNNILTKDETFNYYYEDVGGNRLSEPVDENDIYHSLKTVINKNQKSVNQTPEIFKVLRHYKCRKVNNLPANLSNYDFPGEFSLTKEEHFVNTEQTPYRFTEYEYDIGAGSATTPYNGSFLVTKQAENFNGVPRIFEYEYGYYISTPQDDPWYPSGSNKFNYPITGTIIKDPKGLLTLKNYLILHAALQSLKNGYYNPQSPTQIYESVRVYFIGLENDEVKKITGLSAILYKAENSYELSQNDPNHYYAQLKNSKRIDPIGSLPPPTLENVFSYYRHDQTGMNLYNPPSSKPSLEGNLKQLIRPKGDLTNYYYHPISANENDSSGDLPDNVPHVSFKKAFDNSTIQTQSSPWQDRRVPTRIDKEYAGSHFITHYEKHDCSLGLTHQINSNKFISEFEYDKLNRIKKAVTPYDFSNDPNKGTYIYDYNDAENLITILTKLSNTQSKKTETKFDGKFRVVETRLFTDQNNFNKFETEYNYLGLESKSKDARNLETKFSYDKYMMLSKTDNADNSYTSVANSYHNSLPSYFGSTYNGFVHRQELTDEEGNKFLKYFDALENLLRETKFVAVPTPPTPPNGNGDTENGGENPEEVLQELNTDYRYDLLYRLIEVKSPGNKHIHYNYDAFDRVIKRTTPDNGETRYIYDKNGNLIYSQTQAQRDNSKDLYTFMTYDMADRLKTVGEALVMIDFNDEGNYDIEQFSEGDSSFFDYLVINSYDSINNGVFTPPSDYYSTDNYSNGLLAATAYRTNQNDNWSYKYYRYDARGRIIKVWLKIDGMPDFKTILFAYNSANQITYMTYGAGAEQKTYRNTYDNAGRLSDISIFHVPTLDNSEESLPDYQSFTSYLYNPNSQVEHQNFKQNVLTNYHIYDDRNRINQVLNFEGIFGFTNLYFKNGNVKEQYFEGNYKDKFGNTDDLSFEFVYDKSNRLLIANNTSIIGNSFNLLNTYDADGNIMTLKRYGSFDNLIDDFNYLYFQNTNKLRRVSGTTDQYEYDGSGNMTKDDLNTNYGIKYDYRNLITEFYALRMESGNPKTYYTRNNYDETGNRVRKRVYKYTGSNPVPEPIEDGDNIVNWQLLTDTYYFRSINGNEIAVYNSYNLLYWNVADAGKINADGSWNFYLKDHLGSIRAVTNESHDVLSAQDYDMWGQILDNRSYEIDEDRYKFTGKERDFIGQFPLAKRGYDYFGARYYDARVGRWGSVDSLLEKHYDYSPYNYVLDNPLMYVDPDGKQEIPPYGDPMYHINKETQQIQQKAKEVNDALKELGEKLKPGLKAVGHYTRKVVTGIILRNTLGVSVNIPFISIVNPTTGAIIGTAFGIVFATYKDLGGDENEKRFEKEQTEWKKEIERKDTEQKQRDNRQQVKKDTETRKKNMEKEQPENRRIGDRYNIPYRD